MDRRMAGIMVVLAIGQLIAWGTLGLPAIVGNQLADDFHIDLASVFAGTSVLYVVMGLCAPLLATPFRRAGARRVMMTGVVVAAAGFVVMAFAQHAIVYFIAWVILGLSGSGTLTTAAHIMLNEVAGKNAKGAIGGLMLVTGLSSSIFWPTTAFIAAHVGWRGTCLVNAGLLALICLPLYAFGLPRRGTMVIPAAASAPRPSPHRAADRSTFLLLVAALASSAFVSFGLSAVLVELLKAQGLPAPQAVAFGASLGIVQVSARGVDFLGGGRWDSVTTGVVASALMPAAMLVLIFGHGAYWAIGAFILLYGLGSGAMAVARSTIPLAFYDQTAFAKAMSQIALPLNLIAAASPPMLAALLIRVGSDALLGLTMLCSISSLGMLVLLGRRRVV
ncbi:MFS transporter [Bradyrhizobium jicamae]|nr:MFS transporter [Bradyrhizobium jicamae]MBR0753380.1 MFS transporter [Bradyrhizobium jicamae]